MAVARMLFSREPHVDELEEHLRPAFVVSGECAGDETSPPCDGMEYLRRVRKEAQQLPRVVRAAAIDPGLLSTKLDGGGATFDALPPPPRSLRTDPAWDREVLDGFESTRIRLQGMAVTSHALPLPRAADTNGWEAFCLGRAGGRGATGAGHEHRGNPPLLSTVASLDQCIAFTVLQVEIATAGAISSASALRAARAAVTTGRAGWQVMHARLERERGPSPQLACWIYALLAR